MASLEETYKRFHTLMMEISNLQSAHNLMDWENAVGEVPTAAREPRAGMMGSLWAQAHALNTSSLFGDLVQSLIEDAEDGNLGPTRSAIVRGAWLTYDWEKRLPSEFVERMTALEERTHQAWEPARDTSDWASVLPQFEELVLLKREMAALRRHGGEPYDALLEDYDDGLRAAEVERVFTACRDPLKELAARVRALPDSTFAADTAAFERVCGVGLADQHRLVRRIATTLGFTTERGVLAESLHPFTLVIGQGDIRMTASYKVPDAFWAIGTAAHETGHWLYADAVPPSLYGTSVGQPSFTADEGVARFYENVIGRSREYLTWLMPQLPRRIDPVAAYRAYNRPVRTHIRMGASELDYDLHIMLRTEIERSLVNGSMLPREVPDAWQALSREYLGIVPPDHAHGVLQDDHWFGGYFGYFPTYTLGNLFGSQLYAAMRRDIPDLGTYFARGEFVVATDWLREKVFRHGGLLTTSELLVAATGAPLDPAHHMARLNERYGEICGF